MATKHKLAAPMGSKCGEVVQIQNRTNTSDDRYPTTADGRFCGFPGKHTKQIDGEEIALCERHAKSVEGRKVEVLR